MKVGLLKRGREKKEKILKFQTNCIKNTWLIFMKGKSSAWYFGQKFRLELLLEFK